MAFNLFDLFKGQQGTDRSNAGGSGYGADAGPIYQAPNPTQAYNDAKEGMYNRGTPMETIMGAPDGGGQFIEDTSVGEYIGSGREFAKGFDPSDSFQVKKLQTRLRDLGIKDEFGNDIEVDGGFGPKTEYALRKLQGIDTTIGEPAKDPFGHGVTNYAPSEPSHDQPGYVEKPLGFGVNVASYNPRARQLEDEEREREVYNEQAAAQARYGFQYPMK